MTNPLWLGAPSDAPEPPDHFLGLVADFRDSLEEILGSGMVALTLLGAAVFPRPSAWRLDVDFKVLLRSEPSGGQRQAIAGLHARLARRWPLGDEMDGHYILLDDARGRRRPDCLIHAVTDDAWALHRAHLLGGRLLVVTGTDPREIVSVPDWTELRADLEEQIQYVRDHPQYPAYGVLNGCRILRSFRERNVVHSKAGSAEWGRTVLPEWAGAIAAAVRDYTGAAKARDQELLRETVPGLLARVGAETGSA